MEHTCPACGAVLQIAKSRYKSDKDTTDVYLEMDLVCPNPNCDNFAGNDWSTPKTIVKTISNKVN